MSLRTPEAMGIGRKLSSDRYPATTTIYLSTPTNCKEDGDNEKKNRTLGANFEQFAKTNIEATSERKRQRDSCVNDFNANDTLDIDPEITGNTIFQRATARCIRTLTPLSKYSEHSYSRYKMGKHHIGFRIKQLYSECQLVYNLRPRIHA